MTASSPPQPTVPLTGQVIAVLRTTHASKYLPVIESLVAGGVRFIELTLTTQGVFDHLPEIRAAFGETAEIGIGTVTTTGQVECAATSGPSSWSRRQPTLTSSIPLSLVEYQ